jgi:glycosyltransferase involved in cell wall biosynthesis
MKINRKIRVLMFTTSLGYGGSESDFLRLASYLSRRMDVTIVLMASNYGGQDYKNTQSNTDIPIVLLNDEHFGRRTILTKLIRWWRMLRRLRMLKLKHDATISFLSGPNLLNALAGRPETTIVSERGSKLHHVGITPMNKWLWLHLLDPLTYTLSRFIVPVSRDYAKEVYMIAGPRLTHKIVPIEGSINTIDLINKTTAATDSDISSFCVAPTAVFCGRLDDGKGIDLLIPIFARVWRHNPAVRLLIIGDGPLLSTLIDICVKEGLSVTNVGDPEAVVFLAGYRVDPVRHFHLCRVFCFPSLHEGLPNALIEGVASGIPVLAADCPWGPRSILTGQDDTEALCKSKPPVKLANGTLLPMPNTSEGAKKWELALKLALAHAPTSRSSAARLAAVARFDIEVTGLQWADLINGQPTTF